MSSEKRYGSLLRNDTPWFEKAAQSLPAPFVLLQVWIIKFFKKYFCVHIEVNCLM